MIPLCEHKMNYLVPHILKENGEILSIGQNYQLLHEDLVTQFFKRCL